MINEYMNIIITTFNVTGWTAVVMAALFFVMLFGLSIGNALSNGSEA